MEEVECVGCGVMFDPEKFGVKLTFINGDVSHVGSLDCLWIIVTDAVMARQMEDLKRSHDARLN